MQDDEQDVIDEQLALAATLSDDGEPEYVQGWLKYATGAVAFALACYALYWTQFAINTTWYRASFLAIALALVFLRRPLVPPSTFRRATLEEWLTAGVALGLIGLVLHDTNLMQGDTKGCLILAALAVPFLLYPIATSVPIVARLRLSDWILAALAIWSAVYLATQIDLYKNRATRPTPEEIALGLALIVLILEATRRAIGWILPAITLVFLAYCYLGPYVPLPFDHRGFSVTRMIAQNYLTFEGVFSTPLDVAATFIIVFTLFGSVLARGGAGRFFIDWAFALFGKKPSPAAPGRAVVASGFLLGTVSGSGVATTVTLASLAWPMLKGSGYPPNVAGGMLSAAGIGALIAPPTLGAVAFIIAEYLQVPYLQVIIYAAIPALLYYFSCWLTTEADARKLGVAAVRTSQSSLWALTRGHGYHFLSLLTIALLLALGFSAFMAVFWSIALALALSMLRREDRLVTPAALAVGVCVAGATYLFGVTGLAKASGVGNLFDGRISVSLFWMILAATLFSAFQGYRAWRRNVAATDGALGMASALHDGAVSTLGIVATCACAGLIVSVVNLTGLGLTISSIIVSAGGGDRLVVILLAAIAMWVIGAALPVTASYIIAAVMLVPALTRVGIPEPAAHMFMFYYAVLGEVSPPTALAPFAASAITGGQPFRTMMQTWKYTLPAFVIPVMFCLTPYGLQLLTLTPEGADPVSWADWTGILVAVLKSALALLGLAVGITGYAAAPARLIERVLCGLGGILLLTAGFYSDLFGALLLISGLAFHWLRVRSITRSAR
ncbi:TRAP transporter fused permease subunit [Emcibacter sp. SYSU 3D8]|uniref:TRAP transporter permease n=1 Tax=Emcibacter sp. SYSU 3D8 TaxID=3133969 RepID=UPI0031FE6FEF